MVLGMRSLLQIGRKKLECIPYYLAHTIKYIITAEIHIFKLCIRPSVRPSFILLVYCRHTDSRVF